jgi:hypothetical protein
MNTRELEVVVNPCHDSSDGSAASRASPGQVICRANVGADTPARRLYDCSPVGRHSSWIIKVLYTSKLLFLYVTINRYSRVYFMSVLEPSPALADSAVFSSCCLGLSLR